MKIIPPGYTKVGTIQQASLRARSANKAGPTDVYKRRWPKDKRDYT